MFVTYPLALMGWVLPCRIGNTARMLDETPIA